MYQSKNKVRNRSKAAVAVFAGLLALGAATQVSAAAVLTQGFLTVDRWEGIGGATGTAGISDLETAIAGGKPTVTFYAPSAAVEQTNPNIDQFGMLLWGWVKPDVTGDYDFFTSSDDPSQVFLNPTASGSGTNSLPDFNSATPIAEEDGCCNAFAEPSAGTSRTTSSPIHLEAGKLYGIAILMKEGGGGDYVRVAWRLTTDTTPAAQLKPISGANLWTTVDPTGKTAVISAQPAAVSTVEGRTASFTVGVTTSGGGGDVNHAGVPLYAVTWLTNGVPVPGVNGPTYTTRPLTLADNGIKVQAHVITLVGALDSTSVTLTVKIDNIPPQVLSVGSLNDFNNNSTDVSVIFDKPLKDAASATVLTNYVLKFGTITAARYVSNASGLTTSPVQSGVILTASGVTNGAANQLTIKNIIDTKGNILKSAAVAFTASTKTYISIGTIGDFQPAAFSATNDTGFNLVSGGNAYWGTEDDITMVYETVKGDFDKIAQVEYADPASNWARSGLSARESLNKGAPTTDGSGDNPASRYQMIISDPTTKFDGTAANNAYETNRRLSTGGATSSSNSSGTPPYPNSWVRLKRTGQVINMFYGSDGTTWFPLGRTDFADPSLNANSEPPIGDTMFVGPTYGPENGNIADTTLRALWATRIRNYGDAPKKPRGYASYGIGLKFGAEEVGSALSAGDIAGVESVAQGNWNNIIGQSTPAEGPLNNIVADKNGTASKTSVTVDWSSNNTWASHGPRGEENNLFGNPADDALMTGYLDSGAATTTQVKLTGLPSDLTSGGYDVYVYLLGGVGGGRGGGYRVTDASGSSLTGDYVRGQTANNPNGFINVPTGQGTNYNMGNYIVFKNLKAAAITVEASTDNGLASGGTPRAPINAIQLVPTGGGTGAIADGLVAYWSFDGDLREAVHSYDGTGRGTGTVGFVDAKTGFGKSLHLSGTNYVEITGGSATNLDFAKDSVSIAGWFRVGTFDKNWQALISKGENSNYRVARRGSENTIAYAGGVGEGPDDTPNINDTKWHQFVAVTDGTGASFGTALYIDGVIHSVNTAKAVLTANPSKRLFIGENPDATGRQWKGDIDDIGIWNRVLTPTEVAVLYNDGAGMALGSLPGVPALGAVNNLQISSITTSGGNVTITWTGGGTLQSTTILQVKGTVWTDVAGKTSPATIPIGGSGAFYRIRQ